MGIIKHPGKRSYIATTGAPNTTSKTPMAPQAGPRLHQEVPRVPGRTALPPATTRHHNRRSSGIQGFICRLVRGNLAAAPGSGAVRAFISRVGPRARAR